MRFAKLVNFLWKRRFWLGHSWVQDKIYLRVDRAEMTEDRCLHLQGESHVLTLAQPALAGPHPQSFWGGEGNGTPLERGWLVLRAQGSARCNTEELCSGCSDLHKQWDLRGFFPWKAVQRNIPLKMLGWRHTCYYNLLNRCELNFIRSFDGFRQIQGSNQTVT